MNTHFTPQLVTQILGTKVLSAEKENIGVVQNIMIDPEKDSIIYVVLFYGDLGGSKNKYFLIPSSFLKSAAPDDRALMLNIEQQELFEAPGVDGFDGKINYIQQVVQINEGKEYFINNYTN